MQNRDEATIEGFGQEWAAYDQSGMDDDEWRRHLDGYFSLLPIEQIGRDAEGFDLGCGSGRWALGVAPHVGKLHCIDPAAAALDVARQKLAGMDNVVFHLADVGDVSLKDGTQDFGYSLGVLHHVPDTGRAIAAAAKKLKPGAPLLIYLYYAFDQRPAWFRFLWKTSDLGRRGLSRLPFGPKRAITSAIAFLVYWPLARTARITERLGGNPDRIPLAAYRDCGIYTMRTDALDRFGTRLEQRFTRDQIATMMRAAGLENIRFRDGTPYWVVVGYKRQL